MCSGLRRLMFRCYVLDGVVFKQKTAYEMRISDWSSDVCSSDLESDDCVWQLEYNFYPRTWVLPNDFADFRSQFDANGKSKSVFIVKPDGGCKVEAFS